MKRGGGNGGFGFAGGWVFLGVEIEGGEDLNESFVVRPILGGQGPRQHERWQST